MSALGQRSDSAKAEAGRYPSGADHGTPCAVPLDCKPTVTNVYGVAPDAAGVVRLRIIAFRAHCPTCGWLGRKYDMHGAARYEAEQHRKGRTVTPRTAA